MTIDEIKARIQSSQRLSTSATETNLRKILSMERGNIKDASREFDEDILAYEGKEQAKAESGSVADLGFTLLGAATNPLLGSLASSAYKTATRKKLEAPTLNLKRGLFYNQARKDLRSDAKSTLDFINRANDSFAMNTIAEAARVGFTSSKIQKVFPGIKDGFGSLLTGDSSLEELTTNITGDVPGFASDFGTIDPVYEGMATGGLRLQPNTGLLNTDLFGTATGGSGFGNLNSKFLPSFNAQSNLLNTGGYTSPFGINNLPSN
tara:strand:- start:251 stop:1042 length:792 start_codon:yes stop_codon:yes gene_type:complete